MSAGAPHAVATPPPPTPSIRQGAEEQSSRSVFRILFLTGEYPPAVGGVGDYTAALAAHLRAAGARTGVLTGRVAGAGEEPGVRREVTGWGLGSWRVLDRIVAAEGADLVHIQYQAGAFGGRGATTLLPWWLAHSPNAARRSACDPPVVVTLHDLCVPYLFPKAGPLRPLALRALARGSAATIVTNGEDWQQLRTWAAHRLRLIPIGSNIPPAPPDPGADAALRTRLGVGPGEIVLAYFGLASASKGLDTVLEAVQRLERACPGRYHLLLVGGDASPTDRPRFEGGTDLAGAVRARGLERRVTMTGALPPEAVAAQLRAADLAVLPYRDGASWRRGSLLAALAQGLPVVTTTPQPGTDGAGRLPALADGEDALLIPPGDAAALAATIARVGGDAAARARLASGARATAREFAWDRIATAHLALYRAVLRRPGGCWGGGGR